MRKPAPASAPLAAQGLSCPVARRPREIHIVVIGDLAADGSSLRAHIEE